MMPYNALYPRQTTPNGTLFDAGGSGTAFDLASPRLSGFNTATPTDYLVVAFTAVSWYNALELILLIFATFTRYRGLYFWSLLVSTAAGVVPYSLGFLLLFYRLVKSIDVALALVTVSFSSTGGTLPRWWRC